MKKTFILSFIFAIIVVSFSIPSVLKAGVVRRSTGTVKLNSSVINHQEAGLIGFWTFESVDTTSSTAYDRSGSAFNGTINNFTAFSKSVFPGKRGTSLQFDGIDDNVSLGDVAEPGTITLSAWVKPTAVQTGMKIVSKKMAGLGAQYALGTSDSDASKFKVAFFSSAPSSDICESTGAAGTYVANKWYHVVATYDADTCKMYVNGVDVTSVTSDNAAGTILNSTSALRIGADGGSSIAAGTYFSGLIDDVRIYNYPLTYDQVQKLYQSTGGAPTSNVSRNDRVTNGLVGLWSFDGPDMLSNVRDASGQANHGYLLNFAATSSVVRPGKIGQGLKFDGVDDRVSTASDVIGTSDVTVTAWIKPQSYGGGGRGMIMTNENFILAMRGDNTSLEYRARNNNVSFSGAGSITLNKWQFVTLTRTGTTVNFYVNGVLSGSANQTNEAPLAGSTGVQIGGRSSDNAFNFEGVMDNVRIYNKVLSAAEIKSLYNLGQ